MLRNVELDPSGDPAGRQPGWCLLLMDVVEDLLDRVWFGDRCDDAQPAAALEAQLAVSAIRTKSLALVIDLYTFGVFAFGDNDSLPAQSFI